jgi:hypothetical protein
LLATNLLEDAGKRYSCGESALVSHYIWAVSRKQGCPGMRLLTSRGENSRRAFMLTAVNGQHFHQVEECVPLSSKVGLWAKHHNIL